MTISEVCKKYDLSADTLRYYERIGLLPNVTRSQSGIRHYSEEDCRWVEFIKCMRSAGLTIEFLHEYITLFRQGNDTFEARRALLIEQKSLLVDKMAEMQKTLDRLERKINVYDSVVKDREEKLKSKSDQELLG